MIILVFLGFSFRFIIDFVIFLKISLVFVFLLVRVLRLELGWKRVILNVMFGLVSVVCVVYEIKFIIY